MGGNGLDVESTNPDVRRLKEKERSKVGPEKISSNLDKDGFLSDRKCAETRADGIRC